MAWRRGLMRMCCRQSISVAIFASLAPIFVSISRIKEGLSQDRVLLNFLTKKENRQANSVYRVIPADAWGQNAKQGDHHVNTCAASGVL